MPPRVNVLINTYNHVRFLREAVESVLHQEGVSFDVTIIDDVSDDGTARIIEEFVSANPGLVQARCPPVNLFSSAELRRAINAAEGEFIALMDGDDFWTDSSKLRKQVALLDEHPKLSMCFHDCVVVDDEGRLVQDSLFRSGPPPAYGSYRDIARKNYVPGPSPLIRRSALAPLPDWIDPCDWSDWALHLIAAEHGPVGFLPERMAAYRVHSGGQWSGSSLQQRFEVTRRFLGYFGSHVSAASARPLTRGLSAAWADTFVAQLLSRNVRGVARCLGDFAALAANVRGPAFVDGVLKELWRRWRKQPW